MTEEEKQKVEAEKVVEVAEETPKVDPKKQSKAEDRVVRLLAKDIEGETALYAGLTQVKGISWGISNAICKKLSLAKNKKIGALTDNEIAKIEAFVKVPDLPDYLKNRMKDFETGEDAHLTGSDLDLKKEFDIKRLKKIKSYRGIRHVAGLPTRGQRTRSNFRFNRKKASGIKKKVK